MKRARNPATGTPIWSSGEESASSLQLYFCVINEHLLKIYLMSGLHGAGNTDLKHTHYIIEELCNPISHMIMFWIIIHSMIPKKNGLR